MFTKLLVAAIAAFTAAVAAIGALAVLAVGAATALFAVADFAAATSGLRNFGICRTSQSEHPSGGSH